MRNVLLRFKDLIAIVDALDFRAADYERRLESLCDVEDENERSDLENDLAYLEILQARFRRELAAHEAGLTD